jgi:hypothetical protein
VRFRIRPRALAAVLLMPVAALAHRLDEYLQATRFSLTPDRIVLKLDLTPGVDVAPAIFAEINASRSGKISDAEGRAYGIQVLKEIVLEVDGRKQPLELVSSEFPSLARMSAGLGTIRIEARGAWALPSGPHALFYRNNHRPDSAVYLVNALIPNTPKIAIGAQHRDSRQREVRVEFSVKP